MLSSIDTHSHHSTRRHKTTLHLDPTVLQQRIDPSHPGHLPNRPVQSVLEEVFHGMGTRSFHSNRSLKYEGDVQMVAGWHLCRGGRSRVSVRKEHCLRLAMILQKVGRSKNRLDSGCTLSRDYRVCGNSSKEVADVKPGFREKTTLEVLRIWRQKSVAWAEISCKLLLSQVA